MRWKHLPWLLRELSIDVKDFLPAPQPNPIEDEHMDEAMSSLNKAIRSFLATPRRGRRAWKIDAPDSKLSVLQLNFCMLGRLEIVCLPKLERLEWDTWLCPYPPLSFGVVPSLKELCLICPASEDVQRFVLSEVISYTTSIHTMKLDFQGEKLWMQPEGKQPCTAFNTLRKLSVHGIFV